MASSRRTVLQGALGAASAYALARLPFNASASGEIESHGMSAFGDLKYPAAFKHFDYVEPRAPKGGIFSQVGSSRIYNQNFNTFNSLNPYILKGYGALGMQVTFASLMAPALDEPDGLYGLAAQKVRISAEGHTYRFVLRPDLRFHDGSRLAAHDVAFSLNIMKEKGHPIAQQSMRDFVAAEASDDLTVVARFNEKRGRDVPLFVAQLPIFSKAYYSKQPFDETTLDVPLGSGPYRVGKFESGRYIEYERVKGWWGETLPVCVGLNNFDVLRYEFYRDRETAFTGFTAKNYLFREEFTARVWATRYDFPAIVDGRVKRESIPDDLPSGAQGWFINTRHEKFKDKRVREALIYAFDFEWTNKHIMYDAYKRTHSFFQKSEMMAAGKPSEEEIALLAPFRDKLSPDVFEEPFAPPVSNGSGQDRQLLRKARDLLAEAGFVIKGGKRVSPQGEPLTIEFLLEDRTFEPHHMPFIKNLGQLGIDATLRLIDSTQYQSRIDNHEFDLITQRFVSSTTPGDSLRTFFSSQAAGIKGSQNLAGIADPVVDALIETIIAAPTRQTLIVACRALDRVIRAGRYWVPQWYRDNHPIAYWDVFSRPAKEKPRYARGAPDLWWYDAQKAAKLERGG